MSAGPRWALGTGGLLACIGLVLWFGHVTDSHSFSLPECASMPALCEGQELYVGYVRVDEIDGQKVRVRGGAGLATLSPWPAETPLPSLGEFVSAVGVHGGGTQLIPSEVRTHPHRALKERTGQVMTGLWALLLVVWGARSRPRARA